MKVLNGTGPHLFDPRDNALHATFPQFGAVEAGPLPLMEYNYDAGVCMPDQHKPDTRFDPPLPPMPFGCTGETTTDICSDEDRVTYDPQYTYERTCEMEMHPANQGCDIRNSMKSLTIHGLRRRGETPEQAQRRKRGRYYPIDRVPGRDWFDSFRLALRGNKRSISMGIPWFSAWSKALVPASGLLSSDFRYDGNPANYPWHNVKVSGEETLNGEPVLLIKAWQGEDYGDNGWVKMNRETFNKAFDNWGTLAVTPGSVVAPGDIAYVKAELYQQALLYLNKILAIIGMRQMKIYA